MINHTSKIYLISVILLALLLVGLGVARVQSTSAPPTIKIGLVAPFEGLYRSTGYEVLFAVRQALQERNRGEGINGYRVELVALNDFNNPDEAAKQARALVVDPDLVGVVGHLSSASTLAALPIYRAAQLAVVVPWAVDAEVFSGDPGIVTVAATSEETNAHLEAVTKALGVGDLTLLTGDRTGAVPEETEGLELATDAVTAGNILIDLQSSAGQLPVFGRAETGNLQLVQVAGPAAEGFIFVSPGPSTQQIDRPAFVEGYQVRSGLPPGPRAILAYDATNILLDSIEQAMINAPRSFNDHVSRTEVSRSLPTVQRPGISGPIAFNARGQRINAPVWVFQISQASYPGTLVNP